jgi:hypothetical protein
VYLKAVIFGQVSEPVHLNGVCTKTQPHGFKVERK